VSTSAPAAPLAPGTRCGVHPVRRAVDLCPVCARARCAADAAQAPGGGCPACGGSTSSGPTRGPVTVQERLVRGALAAHAVAVLGGVVAAEYVDAPLFSYLTPFVVGVLTAAAAQAASGAARSGPDAMRIRLLAVVYALLGVALGFVLERSTGTLEGSTLLPYAATVVGVVLWTLPPKVRVAAED
jgi:hypothetical protein